MLIAVAVFERDARSVVHVVPSVENSRFTPVAPVIARVRSYFALTSLLFAITRSNDPVVPGAIMFALTSVSAVLSVSFIVLNRSNDTVGAVPVVAI